MKVDGQKLAVAVHRGLPRRARLVRRFVVAVRAKDDVRRRFLASTDATKAVPVLWIDENSF
jgi:hypothetical protein